MKIVKWILSLFGIYINPKWNECTLSTNWNGSNAQERMMNILSPHMPDSVFKQRMSFMKGRGVNTAHVFVANKADGEYAGYSPFGSNFQTYLKNDSYCKVMTKRLKELRKNGLGIVLWLMADDSNAWAKDVASSSAKADAYCKAVSDLGWFKMASTVVVGLEMDEYWNAVQAATMITAIKHYYKGKIGVHHTSDKTNFAGMADILFFQTNPGKTPAQIQSLTHKAMGTGKPVNFFEIERNPNREKAKAAMDAGAFGCGNW